MIHIQDSGFQLRVWGCCVRWPQIDVAKIRHCPCEAGHAFLGTAEEPTAPTAAYRHGLDGWDYAPDVVEVTEEGWSC